jgi:hypothetical protein
METTEARAVYLDNRKQQQAPEVADVMPTMAAKGTEYVAPRTRLRNVEPDRDGRRGGGG